MGKKNIMQNLLKITFGMLLFSILFISCEKEAIDEPKAAENFNSPDLTKNILEFVTIDANLNNEIEKGLKLNKNLKFDNNIMVQLQNCKTETEILNLFLISSISNEKYILSLLKQKVHFQNLFKKNNHIFYEKTITERQNLLVTVINEFIDKQTLNNNSNRLLSCASEYNTDIGRCNRDALIGSTAAIITAGAGLLPGLGAAVLVMIANHNCKSDAMEDYNSCKN